MQCTVTDYAVAMTPVRRTTQRTVAVDDELWQDCMAIAKVRRQRLSEVIRGALVEYRAQNLALLIELRDAAGDD